MSILISGDCKIDSGFKSLIPHYNMADLTKLQKLDYQKFFIEKGDEGFSPKRNKLIIANSIAKFEAKVAKKKHEFDDAYRERADAVVTYLKAIDRGRVDPRLDHFFTPNQIRIFRGDDLRLKLYEGIRMAKFNHEIKRKAQI